jgi:hypothetical protein
MLLMVFHISKKKKNKFQFLNFYKNKFFFIRMMRLDVDNYPPIKIRSSNQPSLLSKINEEINQLPIEIYSIEHVPVLRIRKTTDIDDEYLSKNGIILRCKLLEKSNPIIPSLRLFITTSYPEQPPEILSLSKTMPPRLEFTGRINISFSSIYCD